MPRLSVAYLLLFAAFLLLLSLSRTPPPKGATRRHGRRLATALHLRHPTFDPLVEKLESQAQERGLLDVESFRKKLDAILDNHRDWSKMPAEIAILEEYFGEEGRLNLTERLMYLFPLLDRFPKDFRLSFHELEVWNRKQALDQLQRSTERKMKEHDKDGDGAVSLREFLSYLKDEELDWKNMEHGKPGWWREQFMAADVDENGLLNRSELNDFLHPEDSSNPKVQLCLLKERLRDFDLNDDGKLSSEEYLDRAHQMHQTHPEFEVFEDEDDLYQETNVKKEFRDLDGNKDQFLTAEELKPIIHRLNPGDLSYATHYTKYLMHEADDDKDGKLTLQEMLNHQHAFYSAVFDEDNYDDYEDYDDHDELR